MKAFLKDNRGVTLVELLIATIVLALITIPLLNSFKTSTRTAVKSEQLGKVSMAAQNILERIEAAEVSELLNGTDTLGATAATHYGKNGDTYVDLAYRTNDTHCIWLQGISSGISSYNAMVEIEPYAEINAEELSVITPIQLIFSQTDEDPDNIVSREIVLEVEKDDAVENQVNAKISYSYEKSLVPLTDVDPIADEDEGETEGTGGTDESEMPGDGEDEENKTETESGGDYTGTINVPAGDTFSIHMLYTPVFDVEDNITIKNPGGLDFDLFLVKKNRNPENKYYKCTINQSGTPIDIYTNVNDNIGESNVIITYNINDAPAPAENGLKDSLVLTQTKDRAHKITVKMYAADADFTAEPLTELKGITLN